MKYANQYSTTRQSRFEESMTSLDCFLSEFDDPGKVSLLSDGGAKARAMYASLDETGEEELDIDNRRFVDLMVFEGMLEISGFGRLIPIVEQIVKNGSNRKESIAALTKIWHTKYPNAKLKYFRGSKTLMTLISPNKNRGESDIQKTE